MPQETNKPLFADNWYGDVPVNELRQEVQYLYEETRKALMGVENITSGTLGVAQGGTGIASYTPGNYIYASGETTLAQRTPAQVLADLPTVTVPNGGTGRTTLTSGRYLVGNGTEQVSLLTSAQVRDDLGVATLSDLDSYLPLSGGTLTGRLNVENDVNDEAAAEFVGYSYNAQDVLENANRVRIVSARAAGISNGRHDPAITISSGATPRNFWIWNISSGTIRLNTQWLRTHLGIQLDAEDGNPDRTIASTVRDAYTRMNGGTAGHSGAQLRLYGDQNTSLPNRGIGYTGGTHRWGWDTTSFILDTAPAGQGTTLVRDSGTGRVYTETSSRRVKKDIESADLNLSRAALEGAQPVWYRSRNPQDRDDWSWWGFIAEDLAEVDPRLVTWGYHPEDWERDPAEDGSEPEPLRFGDIGDRLKPGATLKPVGVDYARFVVHLVNVVKDLSSRLGKLERSKDGPEGDARPGNGESGATEGRG